MTKRMAGATVVVGGALALVLLLRHPYLEQGANAVAAAPLVFNEGTSTAGPAVAKARRVYPYSIVPGGVADRDELAHAVKADKVVAEHYVSFNVARASALTVLRPRAVYVSYRRGDKVYWTANRLMLAPGETVLSDGKSEIRGRCGNRISDVPQLPVEARGPSEHELDASVEVAPAASNEMGVIELSFALDEANDQGGAARQDHQLLTLGDGGPLLAANTPAARGSAGQDSGARPALLASLTSGWSRSLASSTASRSASATPDPNSATPAATGAYGSGAGNGAPTSAATAAQSGGAAPAPGNGAASATPTTTGTQAPSGAQAGSGPEIPAGTQVAAGSNPPDLGVEQQFVIPNVPSLPPTPSATADQAMADSAQVPEQGGGAASAKPTTTGTDAPRRADAGSASETPSGNQATTGSLSPDIGAEPFPIPNVPSWPSSSSATDQQARARSAELPEPGSLGLDGLAFAALLWACRKGVRLKR